MTYELSIVSSALSGHAHLGHPRPFLHLLLWASEGDVMEDKTSPKEKLSSHPSAAAHEKSNEKRSDEATESKNEDLVRFRDKSRSNLRVALQRWTELGQLGALTFHLDVATCAGERIMFIKCVISMRGPRLMPCT